MGIFIHEYHHHTFIYTVQIHVRTFILADFIPKYNEDSENLVTITVGRVSFIIFERKIAWFEEFAKFSSHLGFSVLVRRTILPVNTFGHIEQGATG